jgi:hypothetical protein
MQYQPGPFALIGKKTQYNSMYGRLGWDRRILKKNLLWGTIIIIMFRHIIQNVF